MNTSLFHKFYEVWSLSGFSLPEDLVQARITSIFGDTILSIVSENACRHVVPKLKMNVLAVVYGRISPLTKLNTLLHCDILLPTCHSSPVFHHHRRNAIKDRHPYRSFLQGLVNIEVIKSSKLIILS